MQLGGGWYLALFKWVEFGPLPVLNAVMLSASLIVNCRIESQSCKLF